MLLLRHQNKGANEVRGGTQHLADQLPVVLMPHIRLHTLLSNVKSREDIACVTMICFHFNNCAQ